MLLKNLFLPLEYQKAFIEIIDKKATYIFDRVKEITQNSQIFAFGNDSYQQDNLRFISQKVLELSSAYKKIVLFGTGGSSLGGQALCAIGGNKKVSFFDNLDTNTLKQIDFENSFFVIISKSGNTVETLSQTLLLLDKISDPKNLVIVTSNTENNALKEIAEKFNILTFDHPKDIGGRYSVFSIVGMLPCVLCGLDFFQFQKGAIKALKDFSQDSDIIKGAISQYITGFKQTVLMPYSDLLKDFSRWFAQLWAESLGKINASGDVCGSMPILSLGTVDQHSLLQMYLDGYKNKFFTIITVKDNPKLILNSKISWSHEVLKALTGKDIDHVFEAEAKATILALIGKGCPVIHLEIEKIDEFNLGYAMMYFMLETLAMSVLLEVDPFDQPAVEIIKKLTIQYLNEK
jgi:glucose-6-phosphate isomerase